MARPTIVYILPEAKIKLDTYIAAATGEISGLGLVSNLGQDFLITDVFIFEQKCSAVETILDKGAVSKMMVQLINSGGKPSTVKLWWHSHAIMGVFWSATTDEKTIDGFNNQWMVSVVGNKLGNYLARVDLFKPFRLTLDNLELRVWLQPDDELKRRLTEEVLRKVTIIPMETTATVPPIRYKTVRKTRNR